MVSKRDTSKETTKRSTGEAVEQILVDLPVYVDTQLFIEKGTKLTWYQIKDTFGEDFMEDLEDWKVYINMQRLGLYKVACKYYTFSCADIISWIISHIDRETIR